MPTRLATDGLVMSRSTRERKLLVTPLRAATSPSDMRLASRAWRSRAPKRILSVSSTAIR